MLGKSPSKKTPPARPVEPAQAEPLESRDCLALATLRFEFSKRVQKNPRYSLRSFARDLGLSHTGLSLVLNGRRPPSAALIERLSERLQLSAGKTAGLLASIRSTPSTVKAGSANLTKISLDQFAVISEWQHFAILSLLEIPDTEFEPKFIARRLGISPLLAKVSMHRLVNFGIVEQGADKKWRQRPGPIVVENTVSTAYTRKFQRQLLAKAVDSLHNDPVEKRDFSSTTLAMNPKHVPYALQRVREFRRQLTAELESFGDPEEVYNLTVQIFPTSRRNKP
jgi:transcriptional regulator with XRE-family HTH domain